jgi:DNA-binding response OmpR family regulator
VAKPFSPRELVARLAAVMKRTQIKKEIKTNGKILELGSIKIDTKNFVVWRSDEEVILTKTEFALLEYFLKNAK